MAIADTIKSLLFRARLAADVVLTWIESKVPLTRAAIVNLLIVGVLLFAAGAVLAQGKTWQIVEHRCDKGGAIDALRIVVSEPTVIVVHWDNAQICGKGV